jgi:hypothetical protein
MKMNAFELGRYLDYCNEMLSLIGKLAAVYIQRFDDEVALEAVNEVEMLTASLSDRIWQKLMFLNSIESQIVAPNLPHSVATSPSSDLPPTGSQKFETQSNDSTVATPSHRPPDQQL